MLNLILAIIVTARLDTVAIPIGDQTQLHIEATTTPSEQVYLPVYGENLTDEIEIVDRSGIDTTRLKDGRLRLHQSLTITSFKDSLFYIEPLPFVADSDTLYSEGLTLNVIQPFVIDTALAITPHKGIYKAPIWWKGLIILLLSLLLPLLLVLLGVWVWRRWFRKDVVATDAIDPVLLRPAEEVAIERLDSLREKQLWQQGQTKEYYSELTDVVREYISRRFGVSSQEKTSDETLKLLRPLLKDKRELFDNLKSMLNIADLVKFAKWTTTAEENEQNMQEAYSFVHDTTPEQTENTEEAKL